MPVWGRLGLERTRACSVIGKIRLDCMERTRACFPVPALCNQAYSSPYMLHGPYYLKDRDARPKVW